MSRMLAIVIMAGMSGSALAGGSTGAPAAKTTATAKAKPKPPVVVKKKVPPPNAEHKKELAKLMGGFKFGTSKDDVLGVLQKQIDEKYEERIKQTTDVAAQDRIRKDKKTDLMRVSSSYVAFDGKKTGWDVSIIENEFAHNTNESMMEMWEKDGNKNQRRFFFFFNGKLWKMFVSLDVSILPEDKRNFETFKSIMENQYGVGDVDPGLITWRAGDFDVRAIDRLHDYDALGLAIEDPRQRAELEPIREAKRPPKQETSPVIKSIVDTDHKDHPDMKANGGAVDAVIQAQGGSTTTTKTKSSDSKSSDSKSSDSNSSTGVPPPPTIGK